MFLGLGRKTMMVLNISFHAEAARDRVVRRAPAPAVVLPVREGRDLMRRMTKRRRTGVRNSLEVNQQQVSEGEERMKGFP